MHDLIFDLIILTIFVVGVVQIFSWIKSFLLRKKIKKSEIETNRRIKNLEEMQKLLLNGEQKENKIIKEKENKIKYLENQLVIANKQIEELEINTPQTN